MTGYNSKDISTSYKWLGHQGYTELFARHPEYKPGRENYEWNLRQSAFPRTWYTRAEQDVLAFVAKYHGTHMVCYSENERPRVFKNEKGYARAAREQEIEIARNMFLDLDFEGNQPSKAQLEAVWKFLNGISTDYFSDLGLQAPVLAFTGRGYHLQFAYPAIQVAKQPDLAARQRKFAENFAEDMHKELSGLEAKIDSTQDLRRMVKVYGTSKPNVGVVSSFLGAERNEDAVLKDYLLGLDMGEVVAESSGMEPCYGPKLVDVNGEVPELARNLIRLDSKLNSLWNGQDKASGDTSRSGYDFSLARRMVALGYRDFDGLATTIAARPDGAVRQSGKGEDYIRRTIANALLK